MKVAWLLDAPRSPAARVLIAHVRALGDGHTTAPDGPVDVAVATSLATAEDAFRTDAARRVLLLGDLEDHGWGPGTPERAMARLSLDLPVAFIATRAHVADALSVLRPDAPCHRARLGIDAPGAVVSSLEGDRPLRVLACDNRAAELAGRVPGVRTVATAAEADVALLLGPSEDPLAPLGAFHAGATCVASEAPGVQEIVRHDVNGLLCEPDDERGPARQLELLGRDRALLRRLREGAFETARAWPSVQDAAAGLASALEAIATAAAPDPAPAAARMLADLRGTLAEQRTILDERDALARRLAPVERLAANPALRALLRRRS